MRLGGGRHGSRRVKVCPFCFAALRLRVAHNAVFFGYVAFAPVVPLGKGVFVVIDIALFGKSAPVVDSGVPPVFLIHEIPLCFFRQLQFVQLVDQIVAVIFFALDGGINPIAVKVLCKIDKVFEISGILAQRNRCRKLRFILVALHFKQLSKIIQLVYAAALDNGKRHVKGALFGICKAAHK